MQDTPLYNFAPLASLLLLAALISTLPLGWLWWRYRDAPWLRLRLALTMLTLFLSFDLVLVGAFTRLTDSGLGCPDWPGCYGQASPIGAGAQIEMASQAMPTGPVSQQKAWIEMLHRYLAMAVGALILLQAAWAWIERRSQRHGAGNSLPSPWWATATLAWVCLQGVFGALTVTMKLFPAIVSLHLLGAYGMLALLVVQASLWSSPVQAISAAPRSTTWVLLALIVLLTQSMLGAWVSTNYAVLACNELPTCQGQWWPAMDFASGYELWRPLGSSADGQILSFQALTAIHVGHRMFALVAISLLAWLCWRVWSVAALRRPVRAVACLLLLQALTGVGNVLLDWPLAAAVLHTGGAGALVAMLTWLCVLTAAKPTSYRTSTV